jgi:hypothetical protein
MRSVDYFPDQPSGALVKCEFAPAPSAGIGIVGIIGMGLAVGSKSYSPYGPMFLMPLRLGQSKVATPPIVGGCLPCEHKAGHALAKQLFKFQGEVVTLRPCGSSVVHIFV